MSGPHDHAANIALAIVLGIAPWGIGLVESYGLYMTHFVVPTLSAIVLCGQLWLMWKKRQRKK